MQISAGQSATITKIFIRTSTTGASDRIYLRSIDQNGVSGTLLATFNYASEVNTGSYYETIFTGSLNVTSGTKYWVHYSGTTGNICHDTSAPTYANNFALVTSGSLYQWAYSASTFLEANHWNMRFYTDSNSDVTAPIFPSPETFTVAENTILVGNITTNESSTMTIFGGADQSKFSLSQSDSVTAALSFISAPNYEVPTDVGLDNGYEVVIKALDTSGNIGYETVTATVSNSDENARVISYSITGTPTKGRTVTISVTVNFASKVTFLANSKRIAGCINKATTGSGPITASCLWKPGVRGAVLLAFKVVPTAANNFSTTSSPSLVSVASRTGSR